MLTRRNYRSGNYKGIWVILGLTALPILGIRGCNALFNDRDVKGKGYTLYSESTWIYGHKDYVQYINGSQDLKIYPGLSHRIGSSELYQDFESDGKVDMIRVNGPEWKMHRLEDLFLRETDYHAHKEEFDDADEEMQEFMKKYPRR